MGGNNNIIYDVNWPNFQITHKTILLTRIIYIIASIEAIKTIKKILEKEVNDSNLPFSYISFSTTFSQLSYLLVAN